MQKKRKLLKTLFLLGMMTLIMGKSALALDNCDSSKVETDSGTVSPITGAGASTPPSASLTLSNSNMISPAVTPGSTATASTNVTVNVSNAASYSLTLKFNKATLTGTTTINAGNAVNDNTWGYKWDNAANYSTPSTTGSTLTVPALSNDSANFTKTLAFAAKFASNAEAGHYTNTGTLSLVASPKEAVITLANLTEMQQITPEICTATPYISGQNYSTEYNLKDVRDNNIYKVRKLADGKCWMTSNLKLKAVYNTMTCVMDRKLIPATSDITSEWTMPGSRLYGADFSNDASANSYYNSDQDTGYYSWCAATAGTCVSATSGGQNAPSSICPKGWKLPTGGSSGEFQTLYNSIPSASSATLRGTPYDFAYTGSVGSGTFSDPSSNPYGYWWSRTAYDSTFAYRLSVDSNSVYSDRAGYRRAGYAVRCLAR